VLGINRNSCSEPVGAPKDWNGAIAALKLAALRDPRSADIQNYMGYAFRRLRQWGPAMQHYQEALVLNRRHRSAHEHLGELYLALGELGRAERQLAALEEICLIPCAETEDLKRALARYKNVRHSLIPRQAVYLRCACSGPDLADHLYRSTDAATHEDRYACQP
jgi:tetratricopeptide (TPR) repeat protein